MGRLIAIEGIDGSGKGTQSQRLHRRLQETGIRSALLSFPRYDATFFGEAIGRFLNGEFGSLETVHPFLASLLFAGDRFESRTMLLDSLESHEIVVLDRYVASNVAHQAAKEKGAARDRLRLAIERIEYEVFQMPRPDRTILLDLDVPRAQELIGRKARRSYTERAADIQEADGGYLADVRQLYLELASGDSRWSIVRCDAGGAIRSEEDIATEVGSILDALESSR